MKTAIVLLLLCTVALSQQPAATPTADAPPSREDVLQLFKAMQVDQQMQRMQTLMVEEMKKQVSSDNDSHLAPSQREKLRLLQSKIADEMFAKLPLAAVLDDMVPIYQRYLTRTDVQAMAAFYQTPAGKKMMTTMPEMTRDVMSTLMPKMEQVARDVMAAHRKEFDEIFALPAPKPGPKTSPARKPAPKPAPPKES